MSGPVLLCTDGSDLALDALRAGVDVVAGDGGWLVVTAKPMPDQTLVHGTGMAGGTMSPDEFDDKVAADTAEAARVASATAEALGLDDAEARVVVGDAGPALCRLAAEVDARAIVIGSRGRSGLKRAVLGSVSDHVVRNAPCPVVVVGSGSIDDD